MANTHSLGIAVVCIPIVHVQISRILRPRLAMTEHIANEFGIVAKLYLKRHANIAVCSSHSLIETMA